MVDLQNQLRTSYNQVMLAVLILICLFLEFFFLLLSEILSHRERPH